VIGGRPANGKTTLLLNWVEYLAMNGIPWLYMGMEMDAYQLRRKWAAWRCELDEDAVLSNHWAELPEGAKERIRADLEEQASKPLSTLAHFAPARTINVEELKRWVGFAVSNECRVVVVDHFHRMDFGVGSNVWAQMSAAVRTAKELAIEHEIAVVMAAQLNRGSRDVMEPYHPPPLSALKACGALEEESDVVLMLHRALKGGVSKGTMGEVREGIRPVSDVALENVMGITCRKQRRRGKAIDKGVKLYVKGGLFFGNDCGTVRAKDFGAQA